MNVRNATEADAPAIATLLRAMPDLRSVASGTLDETKQKWQPNLRAAVTSTTSTILVAETAEGKIAGYCAVHWVPFLFLAGGEGYVTELFVHPDNSGNGIGSKLLDSVIAEARERGCARLSLLNGRDGESYKRNFYAQRGWIERDRMANFIFPLTPTHDPPVPS